jgi:hypothetical protein
VDAVNADMADLHSGGLVKLHYLHENARYVLKLSAIA